MLTRHRAAARTATAAAARGQDIGGADADRRTTAALPREVRDRHAELPITFDPKPNSAMAASGIDPDLLRLSIGAEPVEEIIAALAEALGE